MAYARANNLIVLTYDLDFGATLAATGGTGPSVGQIRATDPSPPSVGQRVVAALASSQYELVRGALLTVDVHRNRLRLLPLFNRSGS
jgi:predicted nuclease of predicted toxin-antitoxin system